MLSEAAVHLLLFTPHTDAGGALSLMVGKSSAHCQVNRSLLWERVNCNFDIVFAVNSVKVPALPRIGRASVEPSYLERTAAIGFCFIDVWWKSLPPWDWNYIIGIEASRPNFNSKWTLPLKLNL